MVFGSLWDFSKFVRLEYKSSTTKNFGNDKSK